MAKDPAEEKLKGQEVVSKCVVAERECYLIHAERAKGAYIRRRGLPSYFHQTKSVMSETQLK